MLLVVNRSDYLGQLDAIYRTDNSGDTWELVSEGFPLSSHGRGVRVAFHPEDSIKAYATADTIIGQTSFYRNSNSGKTWTRVSSFPCCRWEIGFTKLHPDTGNDQWILINL
jgi:hypothetical protein